MIDITVDITDTLTGGITMGVVTGTGQDIAVVVYGFVTMKDVTGNDDDCEASVHDADVKGGDERSEADGMSGAMPPEAASRVGVGRLARGRE